MSMQKNIIDIIRRNGGEFLIELKANQRALRYGVEDRLRSMPRCIPTRQALNSGTEESRPEHTVSMTDWK